MKSSLVVDGKKIQQVAVWIHFPRRRAPYKSFAVINLQSNLQLRNKGGLESKILLFLLFNPGPQLLKEIAAEVGATTSAAVRALARLAEEKLVCKVRRGQYVASPFLVHCGRWNAQNTLHLQSQQETPAIQSDTERPPEHQRANRPGNW